MTPNRLTFCSQFSILVLMLFFFGCNDVQQEKKPEEQTKTVQPIPEPSKEALASAKKNEKEVKAVLEELLELAKDGNCKEMASKLIYRGENASQAWKRSLKYENVDDRIAIEKQCGILQVLVMGLKKTDFIGFSQETESEGTWNIWEVKMEYMDGSAENKFFAFLPIQGGFALADID